MITAIVEKTAFAVSTVGRNSYPEAEMSLLENRPTGVLFSLSHSHTFPLST